MLSIAVFASGRGSNFQALAEAVARRNIDARIVLLICNNSDAGAFSVARSFQIPALHLSQKQFPTQDHFAESILANLDSHGVDFIVLAGYMKKLDPRIIRRYRNRILNVHPALLPAFGGAGMYGHHVHEAVIAHHAPVSGATVHIVDEEFDNGPIVLQESIPVDATDTPESLAAKVLTIEHRLLPRAVELFAANKVHVENGVVAFHP
ncbi:MAG TPA: phosphoribosylglycinamide formyltransferase [Bacteroidota bacterium]|nr:phosphoribosylglycinamide formyltransferase [Bacteroidota bacterium]